MDRSFIERLRRIDQQRRGFPGEHWLTLAAGLWFLKRRGGSLPARLTSKAIGSALLWRAASGREGLRSIWGKRPQAPSTAVRQATALEREFERTAPSTQAPGSATQAPGAVTSAGAVLRAADDPETASALDQPENRTGGFPDFR